MTANMTGIMKQQMKEDVIQNHVGENQKQNIFP